MKKEEKKTNFSEKEFAKKIKGKTINLDEFKSFIFIGDRGKTLSFLTKCTKQELVSLIGNATEGHDDAFLDSLESAVRMVKVIRMIRK